MAFKILSLAFLIANFVGHSIAALPPRLTRDGTTDLWGWPGLSYKAVNYVPVCGTLSLSKKDMYTYINTVATCETSMSRYNQTELTNAIYDYTGVLSKIQLGTGTPACMCFSLGGPIGKMDMCINVLGTGTPEGRWSLAYDDIAGGTFISNSIKALPQCDQVDVASISSSVYASLGVKGSASTNVPSSATLKTITTGSSQIVVLTTPTSTGTFNFESSSKLSKENQIALGVGLGMGIPAILLAAAGLYYLAKKSQK